MNYYTICKLSGNVRKNKVNFQYTQNEKNTIVKMHKNQSRNFILLKNAGADCIWRMSREK